MQKLILVRGIPGAGKSTLAKAICSEENFTHLEADMYFVSSTGEYRYNKDYILQAHEWCKTNTKKHLHLGGNVVVSNTFTTLRELEPYFYIAKQYKIVPNVIVCQSNYGSIHGVPEETLVKMKARFQYDISSLYNHE